MSQDETRDQASLADIVHAARLALEFMGGRAEAAFLQDAKTQSAVIHQILIVGDAVKRLSISFREAHPLIPWHAIAGMRDQLIHAYHEVDLSEVWKTVTSDLPALVQRLEQLRQAG